MQHVVVVGHPNAASLNHFLAQTYREAVEARGGTVLVRDLYAMGYDPCLRASEIQGTPGFAPGSDIVAERGRIGEADVFAFIYPLWFNGPPAIIKGYIDRVFGLGFGFGPLAGGSTEPLLTGKRLISITTSGAPTRWLEETGALNAIRTLIDSHLAGVCGVGLVDHVHFGDVTPALTAEAVAECEARVRDVVAARF